MCAACTRRVRGVAASMVKTASWPPGAAPLSREKRDITTQESRNTLLPRFPCFGSKIARSSCARSDTPWAAGPANFFPIFLEKIAKTPPGV